MPTTEAVKISIELTDEQAWQLAQFNKRLSFADCREHAVNDAEAYAMLYAMGKVGRALAEKGYAPR